MGKRVKLLSPVAQHKVKKILSAESNTLILFDRFRTCALFVQFENSNRTC